MNKKLFLIFNNLIARHQTLLCIAAACLLLGVIVGQISKSCNHFANDSCSDHDGHNHGSHLKSSVSGHSGCGEKSTACGSDELAALEEAKCEHQISVIDCDSCRFEVGVVKIAPPIDATLIETGVVKDVERKMMLNLTGQVQLDRTRSVDVIPAGSGQVSKVVKLLGEKVKKGDILAVIHSADLGQAKADFLNVKAKLDMANLTFKREKDLYEKKICSEADYLKALNDLESAKASYAAAEKKLKLFGLESEQIEVLKDEEENGKFASLILRAPQDGMIISQNISKGTMVEATESLYTIADLSNLWVWCDVYEKDLAKLHEPFEKGQSLNAFVNVEAFEDVKFEGAVDLVGNLMDEQTRTVKIRVQVKNNDNKLRPGMFAKVEVAIPSDGNITVIPFNAVMTDEGKHFVFRHLKDNLWVRRNVVTGQMQGDLIEIVDGISKADRIITRGAFMLKSEILKEKMGAGCAH